jgi:hypothetical protein
LQEQQQQEREEQQQEQQRLRHGEASQQAQQQGADPAYLVINFYHLVDIPDTSEVSRTRSWRPAPAAGRGGLPHGNRRGRVPPAAARAAARGRCSAKHERGSASGRGAVLGALLRPPQAA